MDDDKRPSPGAMPRMSRSSRSIASSGGSRSSKTRSLMAAASRAWGRRCRGPAGGDRHRRCRRVVAVRRGVQHHPDQAAAHRRCPPSNVWDKAERTPPIPLQPGVWRPEFRCRPGGQNARQTVDWNGDLGCREGPFSGPKGVFPCLQGKCDRRPGYDRRSTPRISEAELDRGGRLRVTRSCTSWRQTTEGMR